jgi:phosphohistidine phosphatase
MTNRTLLLLRHAKSDWDADWDEDWQRPLNRRGERSARLVGRLLAERDLVPDRIISSPAVRARTTAELAMKEGGWGSELVVEAQLYDSSTETVLEAAAASPPVNRLMLVGHEPTWSALVQRLTGERMVMKTACVAVVDLTLPDWALLPTARGTLQAFINPRLLIGP